MLKTNITRACKNARNYRNEHIVNYENTTQEC